MTVPHYTIASGTRDNHAYAWTLGGRFNKLAVRVVGDDESKAVDALKLLIRNEHNVGAMKVTLQPNSNVSDKVKLAAGNREVGAL